MDNILDKSIVQVPIKRFLQSESSDCDDVLAVEEPLEIRIEFGNADDRQTKSISVTMRTPGNDKDLALGFLFTENILSNIAEVKSVEPVGYVCNEQKQNIIQVSLKEGVIPQFQNTERNFYTTSSCGVCGKGSIDAIVTVSPFKDLINKKLELSIETLFQLPQKLRLAQNNFENTGGIHASGLFSLSGELLILREDVGRHNALDKLIGVAFQQNELPLNNHILLLSGRASFELIQKAAMAGIRIVAAIGAPSSLAVSLAKESDITLVGFLKGDKCNVYHLSEAIIIV